MGETRTTSSTGGQKGTKLARFDLIPVGPLTELAEHYGVGARKYADNQWRQGYEWSKMYAACMRHLTAWWAGFDFDVCSNDPEGCRHVDTEGRPFVPVREDTCFNHTGSHHLAAVAWHAFAGLEFAERFPEHDDRYRPEGRDDFDYEAVATEIIGDPRPTLPRYPDPDPEGEAVKIGGDANLGDGSIKINSLTITSDPVDIDSEAVRDAVRANLLRHGSRSRSW